MSSLEGATVTEPQVSGVTGAPRVRVPLWDNAKAQLIALVVFTHLFELVLRYRQPAQSFYQLILLFHMPAFVFVTGYLSKPDLFSAKGARTTALLVWAFLLANTLNHVWSLVAEKAAFSVVHIVVEPYFALWFLQAMIWWRVLLVAFAWGTSRRAALASIAAAVVVASASGYLVRAGEWLTLSRAFFFLPFYVAGWRASQQGWKLKRFWWTRVVALGAFAAVFVALLWGHAIRDNELLYGRLSYAQMGHLTATSGVTRAALYVVSAVLIAAFLQLVPRKKIVYTVLGTTTIAVYVLHAFSIRLIRFFDQREFFAGSLGSVVLWTGIALLVFGTGPLARATTRILTSRKL